VIISLYLIVSLVIVRRRNNNEGLLKVTVLTCAVQMLISETVRDSVPTMGN